jgi:hypothetical protein
MSWQLWMCGLINTSHYDTFNVAWHAPVKQQWELRSGANRRLIGGRNIEYLSLYQRHQKNNCLLWVGKWDLPHHASWRH